MTKDYSNLHFRTFKTYRELEEAGFSFLDSYEKTKYYSFRFPVCFWKKNSGQYVPTLFAYLTVNSDTMEVVIDVKTTLGLFYPEFYNQEYGRSTKFMNSIYKKIDKKLDELGIISDTKEKNYDKSRNKKNRGSNPRSTVNSRSLSQRQHSSTNYRKRRRTIRKSI